MLRPRLLICTESLPTAATCMPWTWSPAANPLDVAVGQPQQRVPSVRAAEDADQRDVAARDAGADRTGEGRACAAGSPARRRARTTRWGAARPRRRLRGDLRGHGDTAARRDGHHALRRGGDRLRLPGGAGAAAGFGLRGGELGRGLGRRRRPRGLAAWPAAVRRPAGRARRRGRMRRGAARLAIAAASGASEATFTAAGRPGAAAGGRIAAAERSAGGCRRAGPRRCARRGAGIGRSPAAAFAELARRGRRGAAAAARRDRRHASRRSSARGRW